jgi:cytochrome o ubiquinol oxidase subunit 1
LEWSLPSPPPAYNFARRPHVASLDVFHAWKGLGRADYEDGYDDISLPRNSMLGAVIGGAAFCLGFAMTWHIWWLAVAGAIAITAAIVSRSFVEDTETIVPGDSARSSDLRFAMDQRWRVSV